MPFQELLWDDRGCDPHAISLDCTGKEATALRALIIEFPGYAKDLGVPKMEKVRRHPGTVGVMKSASHPSFSPVSRGGADRKSLTKRKPELSPSTGNSHFTILIRPSSNNLAA